ncbi:ADP-heptose synthase / D-glycero-beta-D-manno-heptose 7-phosphate kinase [hydrothermal vent metagenome]|uniref:D-glycero-beta-D-manno-heptose 1-phosphate adenylyltransferase n=1 Tax=hydrothermal vent metagenome TaxID=652676 RepID=A0A3B1CL07_9ZZZZ
MNERLYNILSSTRPVSILVIGDIILDRYVTGSIERISPESPAQVLDVTDESETLGGAANVAATVAAFGAKVSLIGVVGKDEPAKTLKKLLKQYGIGANGIVTDTERQTTIKTRFLALRQQMLRVDREKREDVSDETINKALANAQKALGKCDGVIVSDYGKGAMPRKFLTKLFTLCRKAKKKVIVDPKGNDYSIYKGAELITPNKKEAAEATGIKIQNSSDYNRVSKKLFEATKAKNLLITRGSEGMTLFRPKGESVHIPVDALEVFDVSGAGDTVIAVAGVMLFSGESLEDSARISNIAAGIEVGRVGAWAVTKDETLAKLKSSGPGERKMFTLSQASSFVSRKRAQNKTVVFTNGCFDLLHAGHVKLLQKARTFGDALIVGINSDKSIRRLKGKKRPLLGEDDRLHIIAALDCVDGVILFNEDTPLNLIKVIKPDVLVKGGDYTAGKVVGKYIVEKNGGKVEIIPLVDGKSTSGIIEKILKKYGD